MAKIPEHIRLMLERCKAEHRLVLTASCGCEVGTVVYRGEELPYVDVCNDHKDDMLACTEKYDPATCPTPLRKDLN